MGKAKRKRSHQAENMGNCRKARPVTLASIPWDTGTGTAAQRAGLVIEAADWTDPETGEKRNPNGVKRARRIDLAESMHKAGKISDKGFKAAQALRTAWEATQKSPPAIKAVQVDNSPKPDQSIAMQVDRVSKLVAITRHIPVDVASLVNHVVRDNRSVTSFGYKNARFVVGVRILSDALDDLADKLQL